VIEGPEDELVWPGYKRCKSCRNEFVENAENFPQHSEGHFHARCHTCHPEYIRDKNLRDRYGISAEQWDAMYVAQRGKCAVCGASDCKLILDHCHATGRVRELLCLNCNSGIGKLGDDAGRVRAAYLYLERHNERGADPVSAPTSSKPRLPPEPL
jgi:hypothetical protein